MTGASHNSSAPLGSCTLFKGDTTVGANKRTVVKTVTGRLTMAATLRWGPEPITSCPAPTRSECCVHCQGVCVGSYALHPSLGCCVLQSVIQYS